MRPVSQSAPLGASRVLKGIYLTRLIDAGWSILKRDKGILSLVANIVVVDRVIAHRSGS